ncbi:trehalose-phosphatase [Gryllotalpicola protaetiae]|uniref:trehalose-phosphatase n=1 Tax=Gryllotalpicola protaetiae TaxID=2419771 RepID=UPI001C65D2F4|nr:trehalose-phosphatase [Gryllotalpicola protaetiae]
MGLDHLAAAPRLLVALDFDGTVAPLVDDPSTSRITADAAAAIARLRALPATWVAFVSGRPLDTLAALTASGPDALLVGSHGVEVSIRGELAAARLSDDERARMTRLEVELEQLVAAVPGAWLEYKPVGYGVPTRLVEQAELVAPLQQAARDAADAIGGFTTRLGKDIIEFSVRDVTKGDGVRMLRELLVAEEGGPVAVLYAGDDVTDEDAFAVLEPGDLGVKVGEGDTAAAERVADVDAFAGLLEALAAAREASAASH